MKPNPYLIALSTIALLALVVGFLMTFSLTTAPLGVSLLAVGALALIGWLIVSALVWEKERQNA